mmetsp:Transcript_406/g.770  ORF Transcript_406/g.770 Transcript_406/m.770 type:complete len:276 (-) Transcript_406:643-1470(-)
MLCWNQLPDQQLLVPPDPRFLGVLKDFELFGAVGASLGRDDLIAARVVAQQRLQIIHAVVDDHPGLCRGVLGHLRSGVEGKLLARGDVLQLREARGLRDLGNLRRAGHLRRGLGRRNVLFRGALQAVQLRQQVVDLLLLGLHGRLRCHLPHLRLRAHEEVHPILAGEAPRDLVPHGCSVPARPGQNGVPLLWVVLQEVCEVVDHVVQSDPAVMRLVVVCYLRQSDVARFLVGLGRLGDQRVAVLLDLGGLVVVSCIQSCPLLSFHALKLHLQFLI